NKIKKTCLRAGASEELATKIVKQVERKVYDGISTREILKITLSLLRKEMPQVATRYDLKGALFRLGPAGFAFEHLVAEILREYNYKTKVHSYVKGACVKHEIDIVAEKPSRTPKYFMIECKYHNMPGIYTGLKEVLYTYARFLDLWEGFRKRKCQKFDQAWLVCNTKFSRDAIQYASCKKILILGWKYPYRKSLEKMIEDKKLYPITMLRKLDRNTQDKFALSGLILCKDLLRHDINKLNKKTNVPKTKLKLLTEEADKLLS
ncbi:MAG: restriction endonuclease, partial [Methanosarcinales archaeon]